MASRHLFVSETVSAINVSPNRSGTSSETHMRYCSIIGSANPPAEGPPGVAPVTHERETGGQANDSSIATTATTAAAQKT
jgi:hypothetical protein